MEVGQEAIDAVRDRRVDRASGLVGRAEHEVVQHELRAAAEQLGQGLRPVVGVEPVLLLDRDPRQLAPLRWPVRRPSGCAPSRAEAACRGRPATRPGRQSGAPVIVRPDRRVANLGRGGPGPRTGAPGPWPRRRASSPPSTATSGRGRCPPRRPPRRRRWPARPTPAEALGMSKPRVMSVSVGPVSTACTRDAPPGQQRAQRLGQGERGRLRDRVRRGERQRGQGHHRHVVDDGAAGAGQQRQERLGHAVGAEQVDGQRAAPAPPGRSGRRRARCRRC